MNKFVRPCNAPNVAALSNARVAVVPMAITRPPLSRARVHASIVSAGTRYDSVWMTWSRGLSTEMG